MRVISSDQLETICGGGAFGGALALHSGQPGIFLGLQEFGKAQLGSSPTWRARHQLDGALYLRDAIRHGVNIDLEKPRQWLSATPGGPPQSLNQVGDAFNGVRQ